MSGNKREIGRGGEITSQFNLFVSELTAAVSNYVQGNGFTATPRDEQWIMRPGGSGPDDLIRRGELDKINKGGGGPAGP